MPRYGEFPVGTRDTTSIHDNNGITIRSHRIRNEIDIVVRRAPPVGTRDIPTEVTIRVNGVRSDAADVDDRRAKVEILLVV